MTVNSLQGHLLIASTDLQDPNFAQTVVLIAVHGADGALGLILNREMSVPVSQIWEQVSQDPASARITFGTVVLLAARSWFCTTSDRWPT